MGWRKRTVGPCWGSWIALTSEHVGRGTLAISGGAEFFPLDILPSERESVSKKCFLRGPGFKSHTVHTFCGHGFNPHVW